MYAKQSYICKKYPRLLSTERWRCTWGRQHKIDVSLNKACIAEFVYVMVISHFKQKEFPQRSFPTMPKIIKNRFLSTDFFSLFNISDLPPQVCRLHGNIAKNQNNGIFYSAESEMGTYASAEVSAMKHEKRLH